MHTVIVKYPLPAPVSREKMEAGFRAAEAQFSAVPGLIRKYFCYDEAAHTGHSVYLWESAAQADAFFGAPFMAAMKEKFGAVPELFGVDCLLAVDGPAA